MPVQSKNVRKILQLIFVKFKGFGRLLYVRNARRRRAGAPDPCPILPQRHHPDIGLFGIAFFTGGMTAVFPIALVINKLCSYRIVMDVVYPLFAFVAGVGQYRMKAIFPHFVV